MGQKVIIMGFGGNLGDRLRPETISPLFADLSSTTIAFRDSSFIRNNCLYFVCYG